MSIKLWYVIAAAGTALFLLLFAAWALVQWTRGGGALYAAEAVISLSVSFGLIAHAVLYWKRLEGVSVL